MTSDLQKKLEPLIWDKVKAHPLTITKVGSNFLMDKRPYLSISKENIIDDDSLKYKSEGKSISFKPVKLEWDTGELISSIQDVKGVLTKGGKNFDGFDRQAHDEGIVYKNAFGEGIDINTLSLKTLWRKTLRINDLKSLGKIPNEAKTLKVIFKVNSNYLALEQLKKLSKKFDVKDFKIGNFTTIKESKVWDSSEIAKTNEEGEFQRIVNKKEVIKSYFVFENNELFFIKEIPIDFIKNSLFPLFTDVDITYGSASQVYAYATNSTVVSKISTNKFVIAFDMNARLYLKVATVSGTTITFGTKVDVGQIDSGVYYFDVFEIDTDKFVAVYSNIADDPYAVAATVSGTTITLGTIKSFTYGDHEWIRGCKLDTDKFVLVANSEVGSNSAVAFAATVSGTTITAGSSTRVHASTDYYPMWTSCAQLDTDKFIFVFSASDDGYDGYLVIATVSGTTITFGTPQEFETNQVTRTSVIALDTDKFVICYEDATATEGNIIAGTVSGTVATLGSEYQLQSSDNIEDINVFKVDATHFVVIYTDSTDSYKGKSKYCEADFSDRSMTLGDEEEFTSDTINYGVAEVAIDGIMIDTYKMVVSFVSGTNSNYPYAIIGDISTPSAGNIKELAGVAWASVKEFIGVAEANLKEVAGITAN